MRIVGGLLRVITEVKRHETRNVPGFPSPNRPYCSRWINRSVSEGMTLKDDSFINEARPRPRERVSTGLGRQSPPHSTRFDFAIDNFLLPIVYN
jgi:hypothetical protein